MSDVVKGFREGWRSMCQHHAAVLRDGWVGYEARWERDTEPGYPLPPFMRARRDLGLAVADFLDAIA